MLFRKAARELEHAEVAKKTLTEQIRVLDELAEIATRRTKKAAKRRKSPLVDEVDFETKFNLTHIKELKTRFAKELNKVDSKIEELS